MCKESKQNGKTEIPVASLLFLIGTTNYSPCHGCSFVDGVLSPRGNPQSRAEKIAYLCSQWESVLGRGYKGLKWDEGEKARGGEVPSAW
jgi:hypothetical protein